MSLHIQVELINISPEIPQISTDDPIKIISYYKKKIFEEFIPLSYIFNQDTTNKNGINLFSTTIKEENKKDIQILIKVFKAFQLLGAGELIIPYNVLSEARDFFDKELKIMKSINASKIDKKIKSIKLSLRVTFIFDIYSLNAINDKNINNNTKLMSYENPFQESINRNVLNSEVLENFSNQKKITIKDLCPEEKGKIGELLKKLAKEKEEKELLAKIVEDEKRKVEKLDLIIKEKENAVNNTVLLNSSENINTSLFNMNLKHESLNESIIPTNDVVIEKKIVNTFKEQPVKSNTLDEIKNLRMKFNKVFENLKKTKDNHEEYLSRISTEKNIAPLNNSSSLLAEEKPKYLNYTKSNTKEKETIQFEKVLNDMNEAEDFSNDVKSSNYSTTKNFYIAKMNDQSLTGSKTEFYKPSLSNREADLREDSNLNKNLEDQDEIIQNNNKNITQSSYLKKNNSCEYEKKIDLRPGNPQADRHISKSKSRSKSKGRSPSHSNKNSSNNINIKFEDNHKLVSNEKNTSNRNILTLNNVNEKASLRKNMDNLFNDNECDDDQGNNTRINKNTSNNNICKINFQDKRVINLTNLASIANLKNQKDSSINKYKNLLYRVRENSQEEAHNLKTFNQVTRSPSQREDSSDNHSTKSKKEIVNLRTINKKELFNNKNKNINQEKTQYYIDQNFPNQVNTEEEHNIKVSRKNSMHSNSIRDIESELEIQKHKNNISKVNRNMPLTINNNNNNNNECVSKNSQEKRKNNFIDDRAYISYDEEEENNNITDYYYYNYDFKKKKINYKKKPNFSSVSNNPPQNIIRNKSNSKILEKNSSRDSNESRKINTNKQSIFYSADEDIEENQTLNTSTNSLSMTKLNFEIRPENNNHNEIILTNRSNCDNNGINFKTDDLSMIINKNNDSCIRGSFKNFARNRKEAFLSQANNANTYIDENSFYETQKEDFNSDCIPKSSKNYESISHNNKFQSSLNVSVQYNQENKCHVDEDLIFYLNSKNSRYKKHKNDFRTGEKGNYDDNKDNPMKKRIEFYDNNLFDLIDDIEKKENKAKHKDLTDIRSSNITEKQKEINKIMNELEKEINTVIPLNSNKGLDDNGNMPNKTTYEAHEIKRFKYKYL